ncbi:MAG: bifunctional diguanylate cyclase/phosphodiesterase [Lachnospiraceae bacterium]|nr:bifunctional diguanylate cyclase/phosphodiesterase [Lachnospiraceae bacterium]
MAERIKRWLGLCKDSAFVRDEFDFENMRTSIYMSVVIIVLEIWMIASAVYGNLTGVRERSFSWLVTHIGLYLLLIAVASVVMFYSRFCMKRKKNRHRLTVAFFLVFTLTCILFGTYISYYDYSKGEQALAFISLVVFALCLIVWRPIISLLISASAFYFMYMLMVRIDGASYATKINFFVMWLCLFMCATGNYAIRMAHARRAEHLFAAYEQLRESLLLDELTKLKNRSCMNTDITELIGREVIVAMVDADNFKSINDTYNHTVGDEVLKRVAMTMDKRFSPMRVKNAERWLDYYRYGGDGFILFSSGYPAEEIRDSIREWQKEMHTENFPGTDIHVSLSCGISEGSPAEDKDLLDMIRYADHTLYEAKRMGRMQLLSARLDAMKKKEQEGKLGKRMLSAHETDPLTGLPNMHYFRSHADQMLKESLSAGDRPEFLYFDINNFKEFNETYGFQSGDRLLRNLADRMEELFSEALVARISDDHFIVLTALSGEENFEKARALREMIRVEQRDVRLELKVGIYRSEPGEADASLACDRARIACDSIRNRFDRFSYIYDKELETELHRRHYIVSNLDRAISEGYIRIFYQPIVRLEDGRLCNLEALARWEDPVYGMLSPAVFIDVLEENHLIHKLDLCMAELVCRNLNLARDMGLKLVPISINLSRRDFESCDMVQELLAITQKYRIPVQLLDVEITESALNDHPEIIVESMRRFKEAGFKLWLDDFGSGYSSLNSLKDFPFDVLKIDMKFLSGFEENERTKPILSSVVHMADEINMMALSEGVETDAQRDFLRSIGCERAQGYLFGKPMNREDLTEYILSGKLIVADDCCVEA